LEQGSRNLVARFPCVAPDEFCFDGFEECLDNSIVPAVTFSAHRHFEPQLPHSLLVIVRTILATTVGMMDAARRWVPQRHSTVESLQCKVFLQSVANGPANDPT